MTEREKIYAKVGRVLPREWMGSIAQLLVYAGYDEKSPERWLGERFLFSLISGFMFFFAMFSWQILSITYSIIVCIVVFLVVFAAFVLHISIVADKRAGAIEAVLPSALQLISANIRAGMTPDRAVWLSARPEFGALQNEIKKVGSATLGGTPLEEAFMDMKNRVRSRVLERTVKLIVEGMESGGELAKLLNETANEIRSMSLLKKEMESNVAMYIMFILFASLAGAPLLLGISTFFVEMLSKLTTSIGITQAIAQQSGISLMKFSTNISPSFLTKFAVLVVSVTTFFASLLLGIIQKENAKRGLEYAPIFVSAGIIIFFLVKMLISKIFGSFMFA